MSNQNSLLFRALLWVLAGTLIAPLIAFQYSFMGLVFIKTIGFFALVEVALILYLILLASKQVELPRNNLINWLVGGFLVVLILSTVTSIQPYLSFWGSYSRIFGLLTWLHLGAFFYIANSVLTTQAVWSRFLHLIIWSSAPVALYGIGQYLNISFLAPSETMRVDSTIGNPLFLTGYLLMVIPMTWVHFSMATNRTWKWLLFGVAALQIVCLILSGSRSGLIALAVAVVAVLLIGGIIYRKKLMLWMMGAFVAVMVMSFGMIQLAYDTPFVQNYNLLRRIGEIRLDNPNNLPRLTAWRQGIEAWQDRPFLGWGLENFSVALDQHYEPGIESYAISETWLDRAHNLFIDLLVMTGILGLLAYLALLGVVLAQAWKNLRTTRDSWVGKISFAILVTLLTYIAFGVFAFDTIASIVFLLFYLALLSGQVGKSARLPRVTTWAWLLVPAVVVALYPFVVRNIIANKTMSGALVDFYAQDFVQAEAKARQALAFNSFINNGIRNRLIEMSVDAFNHANQRQLRPSIEPVMVQMLDLADDFVVTEPHLAFLDSKLLWSYAHLTSWDSRYITQAERVFEDLVALSPNRPDTYVTMGNTYSIVSDHAKADERYAQALAIHPDWGYIHYAQGINQLLQGRVAEAQHLFELAADKGYTVIPEDPRLVDVALRNTARISNILELQGRLELAEQYHRDVIKKFPELIPPYIEIAKFYFRQGRVGEVYQTLLLAYRIDASEPTVRALLMDLNKRDPQAFPLPSV